MLYLICQITTNTLHSSCQRYESVSQSCEPHNLHLGSEEDNLVTSIEGVFTLLDTCPVPKGEVS